MFRSVTVAATTAVAVLALAGCSSSGDSVAAQATVTKTATVTVTQTAPESAATHTSSVAAAAGTAADTSAAGGDYGDGNKTQAFGTVAKFGGWSMQVSAPAPYSPTADAMSMSEKKWANYRVVTLTLRNTGSKPLDPSLDPMVQANVDGNDADELYDSPLPDAPSSKLLPGQSATWKMAFGTKSNSKITVQVGAFLGDTTVIFQ